MKTLGQIAWEVMYEGYGLSWDDDHSPVGRAQWERIAQAVADGCAKVCAAQWQIDGQFTADEFAAAIRARAEVKK